MIQKFPIKIDINLFLKNKQCWFVCDFCCQNDGADKNKIKKINNLLFLYEKFH
jgi:hypothetical protein